MPRQAAERVQQQVELIAALTGAPPTVLGLATIKRDPGRSTPPEPAADWQAFEETLTGLAEPSSEAVFGLVTALLRQLAQNPPRPPASWDEDLQVYLSDPYVAGVVEEALLHVADAEPLLIALIRHAVMSNLWRQPLTSN
ncbi:MAG: hypothetical protein JWM64_980 [Frankiales bacterium]|nr:hypothetical protein [Frankiales bacterium]